jgi:gamma-glutamylcyclotransferase
MKTKLYFAYGMNTNRDEMAFRCPTAVPMGKAILPGYRFEFKSFATIVPDADSSVEGVLWTITESDESALDILEGYPEFYDKKHVKVSQGIDYIAMTYIMNPREKGFSPSDGYYGMVSQGYQQFGLSQQQLLEARSRSIQETIVYE